MILFLISLFFPSFRGPIPFSCLRENGMGALHQHGRHKKNLRFLGGFSGVLRLLEQLLLNFCNLDVDALTHKPD